MLILLPEIALTPAVLERVEGRFGFAPAAWHSGMTPARRREVWERVVAWRGEDRGRRPLGVVPAVQEPCG